MPEPRPGLSAGIDADLVTELLRSDPRVASASGCLQCGTCTPFCPGALDSNFAYIPRRVTAALAHGSVPDLDIDQCVQCHRCGVFCPRGISVGAIVNALYEARGVKRPFREAIRGAGMIPPQSFVMLNLRERDTTAFAEKKARYRRTVTTEAQTELQEILAPDCDPRALTLHETEHRPQPPVSIPDEVYGFQSCCSFNYPGIAICTDLLLNHLGIGVRRSKDETCCCGAPHYLGEVSRAERILVGARNLTVVADTMGTDGVITGVGICPTCYSTYQETLGSLSDPRNHAAVNARLDRVGRRLEDPSGFVVFHILEILDACRERLRAEVAGSLKGLRVGIHQSCHFRATTHDSRAYETLKRIIAMTGAEHVPSVYDSYCCGGVKDLFCRYLADRRDQPSILNRESIDARRRDGIDLVVVDCPGCMLVYDQNEVPVVHIAELMAVAVGSSLRHAGLSHHFTPVIPVFDERGINKESAYPLG